jgi:hypothetical protein
MGRVALGVILVTVGPSGSFIYPGSSDTVEAPSYQASLIGESFVSRLPSGFVLWAFVGLTRIHRRFIGVCHHAWVVGLTMEGALLASPRQHTELGSIVAHEGTR